MNLPIWVTVFISGIVGGWIGRAVSSLLVLPLILGGTSPETFASNWALVVVIGGVGQAAVTGVVLLACYRRSRRCGSASGRRSSPCWSGT